MNESEFLAMVCNLLKGREKMARTRCDWFGFGFSFVEKRARDFKANHISVAIA